MSNLSTRTPRTISESDLGFWPTFYPLHLNECLVLHLKDQIHTCLEPESTVVGTPSKSKHKIAIILKFWVHKNYQSKFWHLSKDINYFDMKYHGIMSFYLCLQKLICKKTEDICHFLSHDKFIWSFLYKNPFQINSSWL